MEKEEIQKLQVIINILDYDSLKELLRQPTEAVEETLAGAREFLTTLTTSRPSRQMEIELKGLEEIVGLYQIFSSDGKLHPILETQLGKELISDIKRWASSHPSPESKEVEFTEWMHKERWRPHTNYSDKDNSMCMFRTFAHQDDEIKSIRELFQIFLAETNKQK